MERQYIGARYVPKFFENPNTGDASWLSGVAYEALTIVTIAGNTYTSKKQVPASIGSPNSNPEYWVATGLFNAQVDAIREKVEEIQTNMNKARQFILIGDSFGNGIDGNNNTTTVPGGGWISRFRNSVSNWATVYNSQTPLAGVYGFASSRPFLDVLQDAEQNIPDKTLVTDIVVLGGTNDIGIAEATVKSKISEFVEYCHANYPKARVAIGCLGSNVKEMVNMGKVYNSCVDHGAEYISDLRALYCLYQYIGADGVHLTEAGYAFYTPYVNQAILTGHSDWRFSSDGTQRVTVDTSVNTIFSTTEDIMLAWNITNRNFYLGISGIQDSSAGGYGMCTIKNTLNYSGFYPFGTQHTFRPPLEYKRSQNLFSPTHILELYPGPGDTLYIATPPGMEANQTIHAGETTTKLLEY